jgi:hypothetical protein
MSVTMHHPTRRRVVSAAVALSLCSKTAFAQDSASAIVADTAEGGGPGGGTFFVAVAVNGAEVRETALTLSMQASRNRGAYMAIQTTARSVLAGQVTLKLLALQTHAMPITTIFRAAFKDGDPRVDGTVTVDLAPGQRYRVNGFMDPFRREVWIEDSKGIEVPGSKVIAPANPELLKQMDGAVFTKTNLRYEDDWINDASLPQLPFVPAGSRIKVTDWGKQRAAVLIDGRKMRLGVDYTRETQSIQNFFAAVTTPDDPRPAIAALPEATRNAVRAARVLRGMTREQVLVSLGRPRLDLVPSLDAKEWRYDVSGDDEIFLVFADGGALAEVDGSRKARKLILYEAG